MYWYVLVCTKTKFMNVHHVGIQTDDLVHTNQLVIPLCYKCEVLGDENGVYRVYILYRQAGVRHTALVPLHPPVPAMT
jgi:hypothetical protein